MEKKHSGIGIASFIISVLTGISMLVLFVIAGVMENSTPGGINEESTEAMVFGVFIFAALFACLLALGLGAAGLFQKDRKKTFAILGTVFSIGTVAITILCVVIGVFAK